MAEKLLDVRNLKKHFPIKGGILSKVVGYVYAVDGISFFLNKGETLGLVVKWLSNLSQDTTDFSADPIAM